MRPPDGAPTRFDAPGGPRRAALPQRYARHHALHPANRRRGASTPEIPTTLPTLDEVLGREQLPDAAAVAHFYLNRMDAGRLNVHTVHAETEGIGQLQSFTALIRAMKEAGAEFLRLDAVAARLDRESIPVCPIVRATLPGRSGWIAAQGAPIHAAA